MIDVRELRVGNYVLDLDGSLYKIASGTDIDGSWKPIPLAGEWLIRFGFNKDIKQAYSLGYRKDFDVYTLKPLTYNQIQALWYCGGWHVLELQPEYVHTLQNLFFSLTGEELKPLL